MRPLLLLAACQPALPSVHGGPTWPDVAACAPARHARVGCVVDGDTFDLGACGTGAERVRLLGIDAPELAHGGQPADCFGERAAQAVREAIVGRIVRLTFDTACTGVYDRTLAHAWLDPDDAVAAFGAEVTDEVWRLHGDSDTPVLLGSALLLRGLARRYGEAFGAPPRWEAERAMAEQTARARGEGLWGACGPH